MTEYNPGDIYFDEMVVRLLGVLSDDSRVSEDLIIKAARKIADETSSAVADSSNIMRGLASLRQEGFATFEPSGWFLTRKGEQTYSLYEKDLPDPWEGEPYLKAIGVDLPCYVRGYDEGHHVCGVCPVQRSCAGLQDIRASNLARHLERMDEIRTEELQREKARRRQEEEARLAEAMRPDTPAQKGPEPTPIEDIMERLRASSSAQSPAPVPFVEIPEAADGTYCAKCKQPIKGACRFREGEGYYHVACEDK